MYKYLILLIILLGKDALPQSESDIYFGVQADFTSVIFVNTFSGSFDVDFYKIDNENYLGTRLAIDYIGKGSIDGSIHGSPYTDIDLFAKLSLSGKYLEVNFCPGFTIHNNTGNYRDENGFYLKGLGELKFKIYRDYIGLICKVALSKEPYGGLGLYLGYNSRDSKKK
jgi:hypothetical protein